LLDVTDLDAGYADVTILRGVRLTVAEGEIVALVGANGVGKTTLLRAVSGLLHSRRGCVGFRGDDVTGGPCSALWASVCSTSGRIVRCSGA
jgi:branched-chain amino acid transport system ATP-binding protein